MEEDEQEKFERRKVIFEEGIEAENFKANEKSLLILILTIRIHWEAFELSIRNGLCVRWF